MPTIIDVAKEAGLSKSTVSRVLSGNGYVSQESKEKILVAMEKLGYAPNLVARNLQSGSTRTIGFIAQSYFDLLGVVLDRFISIAKKHNYYVTLFFTDGDKEKEIEALDQLKYKQLDGIFLLTRSNEWAKIESYSIYGPLATWHRLDSNRIYSSYVDHYPVYSFSLDYLYKSGYRKIGHVLGSKKNLNTRARIKAIETFNQKKELYFCEDWLFFNHYHSDGGRSIARLWATMKNPPEAMAFYTDSVAAEFISELELLQYSVPQDVGVIGFDNSEISKLMHITSVDYSIESQAENAFIYLYNQLHEQLLPEKKLPLQLIKRRTIRSIDPS